jgi:acetolactate synthase-1/2/3 large subunit
VATDLLPARYDLVAIGLGGHGERVEREAELRPALERALAAVDAGRPGLVDVRIASAASPAGAPP